MRFKTSHNKRSRLLRGNRSDFLVACLFAFLLLLTWSCTARPVNSTIPTTNNPTDATPNYLQALQQKGKLEASFHAFVTLSSGNSMVSIVSEFVVPKIPINWAGSSFTGNLEEAGPGEDVFDEVYGSASDSGDILLSLVFSKRITSTVTGKGTFFRITLQNIPIITVSGSSVSVGTFDGIGPSLQNYIVKIEYIDGYISNGQIVPVTTYVSTDWSNTNPGQMPALQITFGN